MNLSGEKNDSAENISSRSEMILPGLLSIALLGILFSVPQPATHVNQPFKVELLLSLFLIVFFAGMAFRKQKGVSPFCVNKLIISIAIALAGFVLWSAASFAWGASLGSVAHHTLLWSVYLIFFLNFTGIIPSGANFRFIATTCVFATFVLGLLCLFDYLTVVDFTSSEGDIRIRYGKYAELLVTIAPLIWAVAIYTKSRRRQIGILLIAVIGWVTVMLSLSKGAFIGGIIGFSLFFTGAAVFSGKTFRRRIVAFAGVWLAITIGTQVFFSFFSAVPSTTNYISGAADQGGNTSAMRLFTWNVARRMVVDHWLIGVGADNFGLAFNPARALYRETHPDGAKEEIAEDYIVERAHNEPLQVLAELGVIGLVLFSLPLLIFGFYFAWNLITRRRMSPILCAAAAGMAAFLVSSQFSSFSFRSAQNGVAFFMVFAVAVCELSKTLRPSKTPVKTNIFLISVVLVSWVVILLLAIFCLTKVVAEYHLYQAERSTTDSDAAGHFQAAVAVDHEYAGAYLSYAARVAEDDPSTAVALTRKAIENGLGIAIVYSQLAKRQIAAGDANGAEATFREALSIYPRSLFLRTEFIVFLEDQGRSNEAADQAAIARTIDLRHANGWYMMIRQGSVAAFYRAQTDKNIAPPAELAPSNGVRQYLDKIPGTAPTQEK
jgi:O-antigen ligase